MAFVFKEGGDLFIFIDCGEDDTEKEIKEWNSVIWVPTILWCMLGICYEGKEEIMKLKARSRNHQDKQHWWRDCP